MFLKNYLHCLNNKKKTLENISFYCLCFWLLSLSLDFQKNNFGSCMTGQMNYVDFGSIFSEAMFVHVDIQTIMLILVLFLVWLCSCRQPC